MNEAKNKLMYSPGLKQALDEELKKPEYRNIETEIAEINAVKAVAKTQPEKFTEAPADQLALLLIDET
jgi:hypothetical protein